MNFLSQKLENCFHKKCSLTIFLNETQNVKNYINIFSLKNSAIFFIMKLLCKRISQF